jgi:hypothetical protein
MKEHTMRKLMTICAAVIALAIPASALAHDGHGKHHHFGWHHHHAALAKLTGTGTSFGGATATASGVAKGDALGTGTFSATLSTNWSAATTKTSDHGTLSCAPSTATLSLVGATAANTLSSSALTGKTCAWTKSGGTTVRMFFGKGTVAAAGTLASLNGLSGKAFLLQKADGTVTGGAFAGKRTDEGLKVFSVRQHDAAHKTGNCDHNS